MCPERGEKVTASLLKELLQSNSSCLVVQSCEAQAEAFVFRRGEGPWADHDEFAGSKRQL
jgi:hypothetical protein